MVWEQREQVGPWYTHCNWMKGSSSCDCWWASLLTGDYAEGAMSRVSTSAAPDLLDKLQALNMHFLQIGDTLWAEVWLSFEEPRRQETNWLAIKMEESKRNWLLWRFFTSIVCPGKECACIFHGKHGPKRDDVNVGWCQILSVKDDC